MGFTNSRTRPESRLQRHRLQAVLSRLRRFLIFANCHERSIICLRLFSHTRINAVSNKCVFTSYWPLFIIWEPVVWVRGISTRENRTWGLKCAHFWVFLGKCEVQNNNNLKKRQISSPKKEEWLLNFRLCYKSYCPHISCLGVQTGLT